MKFVLVWMFFGIFCLGDGAGKNKKKNRKDGELHAEKPKKKLKQEIVSPLPNGDTFLHFFFYFCSFFFFPKGFPIHGTLSCSLEYYRTGEQNLQRLAEQKQKIYKKNKKRSRKSKIEIPPPKKKKRKKKKPKKPQNHIKLYIIQTDMIRNLQLNMLN